MCRTGVRLVACITLSRAVGEGEHGVSMDVTGT
jgi:hypothetical protein